MSKITEHDKYCESYAEQGPRLPVIPCKCRERSVEEAIQLMGRYLFGRWDHEM